MRIGAGLGLLAQQPVFIFNNIRTDSERIAIHTCQPGQALSRKLDGKNVNRELPVRRR